ncbi:MAG TPA: PHP domain-containing protein [Kofleriaceae bacterium]|nr:PHP domain-containing protein [Kofleriaceae bacterium]
MWFELHCHSTASDGSEPPDAVAARAAARGVEVFALTDHDTCTPVALAGARVLRGVELSCDDPETGRTIHVLAYDRGGAWGALEARLAQLAEARRNRLRVMAARLAQRGIHVDVEPILARAGGRTVGRPDLAHAMVAIGAATSKQDAFARHLYDGGPVDVPHRALALPDALALGRAAGAALSLAHPHTYGELSERLLRRYHRDGLDGVEAFYAGYDPGERARWTELADQLGLVCTGGSDWHGPEDARAQPGVELAGERARGLLDWLGR